MKYIARVPATKLGFVFIETLKEHLNTEGYKVVIRYTGKRVTRFGGHTRKGDADSVRVYIEPRSGPSSHLYEVGDTRQYVRDATAELQIQLDEQEQRLVKQAQTIDQLMERDSQIHKIKEILNGHS